MSEKEEAFDKGKAKVPTGINSIDLASDGGFPAGSLVILFGDAGSGRGPFGHTAAFMNAAKKKGILDEPTGENVYLPENIFYLLLSKTERDVNREVSVGYSEELSESFKEMVRFKDFMSDYYSSTFASLESGEGDALEEEKEEDEAIEIVKSMIEFLDDNGKRSLIIIDSLDDLIRAFPSGEERDLLASLKRISSRNKEDWNSLILIYLTRDLFPEKVEKSIFSLADGVFEFESRESGRSKSRKISCNKFSGITSKDLLDSTFEFSITNSGLEARRTSSLEL